jgi:hypothetical protein
MFRLNPVGALIMEFVGRGSEEAEIATEISRQYGISQETAIGDLREFMRLLQGRDLIHRRVEGRIS